MLNIFYLSTNIFIAISYFTIAFLLYRGLRQGQHLLNNPLILATAAIFFSCALGHSMHVLTAVVFGGHQSSSLALEIQAGFDLLTAIIAGIYLALRRQYSIMIYGSALLTEMQNQLTEANPELAKINPNLELFVAERVTELLQTNEKLKSEIAERQRVEGELRENEQRFRQLAENITKVFWLADIDKAQVIYVSPAYEEVWGRSCESLYNNPRSFLEVIHPEDRDRVLATVEKYPQGEYEEEYRIVQPDGSIRWIRDRGFSIKNAAGQVYRIAGIAEDITYRVQAEEELERQNLRSRLFAEIALKIRQSLQLEEILQTTVKEVLELFQTDRVIIYKLFADGSGKVVTEAVTPGWSAILNQKISDPCFSEKYIQLYRQGRISTIADLEQSKSHPCHIKLLQHFEVKANLVVPILQGKELWGLLIAHQCASTRQWTSFECELLQQLADQVGIALAQAQFLAALQESEQRYHTLAKVSPVGIYHTDAEGQCLYVNEKWCAIAGISQSEAWGVGWVKTIYFEDRERVFTQWCQATTQNTQFRSEYRFHSPDGKITWVFGQAVANIGNNGEVTGYVGTVTDITERKLAEEKITKALEKEKELSELKNRFVSMTSHEFRTPLSTILSSTELLQHYSHKFTEDKKLKHFQRIGTAVQQMTQLLNDILIIGKAEAGKLNFNPKSINLFLFCQELVQELQLSDSKQHTINFVELTGGLTENSNTGKYPVLGLDEKLLRHILSNLLSNALKYSPKGSTVHFQLALTNSKAIFEIQDSGIGIPPEDIVHLFESFHRASNVGTISGTGLGLAIVKKCVDLHAGKIEVKSEVEVGTMFRVTLPINQVTAHDQDFSD